MKVKSIAECSKGSILQYFRSSQEHFAILSTFNKLPFVIKIFVLSIFEWPFKTGFTEHKRLLFLAVWFNTLVIMIKLFRKLILLAFNIPFDLAKNLYILILQMTMQDLINSKT